MFFTDSVNGTSNNDNNFDASRCASTVTGTASSIVNSISTISIPSVSRAVFLSITSPLKTTREIPCCAFDIIPFKFNTANTRAVLYIIQEL